MIRILVVDDHPVVRAGIVALLESAADVEIVGTAASGEEALALVDATAPDLVVMDLRMPGIDGDEATARILAAHPGVRVLILTTYETDDAILSAIAAGASGYLLKAAPEEELLAGVRAVAAGRGGAGAERQPDAGGPTRAPEPAGPGAVAARARGAAARRARASRTARSAPASTWARPP